LLLLTLLRPPTSTLFPYTTLFRSVRRRVAVQALQRHGGNADVARVGGVEQTGPEDHRREQQRSLVGRQIERRQRDQVPQLVDRRDRKSTRLNSSHVAISYAVFCLK